MSFYFYWTNPFSDYAVINAITYLSASGYLRAHAGWSGSGLFGYNTSWVEASAAFGLWFGVSNDLKLVDYATESVGGASALSTITGADVESTTISAGTTLSRAMFAVPSGNTVVFEVALFVDYGDQLGNIEADFANGDFQIECPVVVFSLVNSPPGSDSVAA